MRQRMVILKADNLGFQPGMSSFRRLIDIGDRRRIPHSIGVITNRLSHLLTREVHYLRACFEDPLLELWNHSHTHRKLVTLTQAQQAEDIRTAQRLICEQLGVACTVFGAPYNQYNADSIAALQECGELDAMFLVEPTLAAGSRLVNVSRETLLSPEFVRPSTRQNDLKEFIRRYELLKNAELMVIQFHPPAWNEHGFSVYEQCLDYLLEQGVRFVTMRDYVALQKARTSSSVELPIRAQAIILDASLDSSASALKEKYANDRRLSAFFFNRHQLGTQHVLRCFERIGFDSQPELQQGTHHSCLDIGCGAGNWLTGYGLLHPDAALCGLDALDPCTDIAQSQLAQAGMGTRATIRCGTVEQPLQFDHCFDRIWCINAAQYMDKEALFTYVRQALKHRGAFFLNIQTEDYFLGAAMQQLSSSNADLANAAARLDTLIASYAQRMAVRTRFASVRAYDHEELMFCARQFGLDMVVESIHFEDKVPAYREGAMMKSYLMENNLNHSAALASPNNFIAQSIESRSKHLKELRQFGMWRSLRILYAECPDAIPEEQHAEIMALVQMTNGVTVKPQTAFVIAGFSTATQAALAINCGDLQAPILQPDKTDDAGISFLRSLSAYLRGDLQTVMRDCLRHQNDMPFDRRQAVLAAAASCKKKEPASAIAAIEALYQSRNEAADIARR